MIKRAVKSQKHLMTINPNCIRKSLNHLVRKSEKMKQVCKVITFLILLSSDTLSLLWTPLSATTAFPPDPLSCQCLSTAAPPHQICLPWVRSNLFPTPVSWGGQAGCLLLRTEHATKHSREEWQPMETSPRLRPPSPGAETGTRRC